MYNPTPEVNMIEERETVVISLSFNKKDIESIISDLQEAVSKFKNLKKRNYNVTDSSNNGLYFTFEKREKPEEQKGTVPLPDIDPDILNKSVEELDLSVRAYNCIRHAEIKTVGELISKSRAQLLEIKHFGRKSLRELEEVLSEMGLSLKRW